MNLLTALWALIEQHTPQIITVLIWIAGGLVIALVWVGLAFLMAHFCGANERTDGSTESRPTMGPGRRVKGRANLIEQGSTPV